MNRDGLAALLARLAPELLNAMSVLGAAARAESMSVAGLVGPERLEVSVGAVAQVVLDADTLEPVAEAGTYTEAAQEARHLARSVVVAELAEVDE